MLATFPIIGSQAGFGAPVLATGSALDPFSIPLKSVPDDPDQYSDKAVRLAKMYRLGITDIPAGEVISASTVASLIHHDNVSEVLATGLRQLLDGLESTPDLVKRDQLFYTRKRRTSLLDDKVPLILAVRTGGSRKMAGLLPTIQGVGLNHKIIERLVEYHDLTKDEERRLLEFYLTYLCSYAVDVRGIARERVAKFRATGKQRTRVLLNQNIEQIKRLIKRLSGNRFPQDPMRQLTEVTLAVGRAWDSQQARDYRARYKIDENPASSIIVQRQVFGFLDNSFAAVAFSRDPLTGEPGIFGQILRRATGPEIMTGTTRQVGQMQRLPAHERQIGQALKQHLKMLEWEWQEPVEVELVMEQGALFFLQGTRLRIPSPVTTLQVSLAMHEEGIIDEEAVLARTDERRVQKVLSNPSFQHPEGLDARILLAGESMYPGAVVGPLVFDVDELLLQEQSDDNKPILATEPFDPMLWDEVLSRIQGIVTLGHPGAHFYERAAEFEIPILTEVQGQVRLLGSRDGVNNRLKFSGRPGRIDSTVTAPLIGSLDTIGEDGFLALGELPYSDDREIAAFIRERMPLTAIQGRRAREQAALVTRFNEIKRKHSPEEFSTKAFTAAVGLGNMDDVVEAIAQYPKRLPRIQLLREVVLKREWIEPEGCHDDITPDGVRFFRKLYERSPDKVADIVLATTVGMHDFAIGIFESLTFEQQIDLINRMVHNAREKDIQSGWEAGVFLVSRLFGMLIHEEDPSGSSEDEGEMRHAHIRQELSHQTLRYVLEELFVFDLVANDRVSAKDQAAQDLFREFVLRRYSRLKTPVMQARKPNVEMDYIRERIRRYPGLDAQIWVPFLQELSDEQWNALIQDPELPVAMVPWLREVLGKND